MSFAYNADGLRTSKTVNGVTTDHGKPKHHTNPHDHDISWVSDGNPVFSDPKKLLGWKYSSFSIRKEI